MRYSYVLLLLLCSLWGCGKKVKPTTVIVQDPERHYYPLLQGEDLYLSFRLANTGETPFVIGDIHPSCGCILIDTNSEIILPGKEGLLRFKYQSAKNIGYVRHTIRLYGNVLPKGIVLLIFDVNVVPSSDYTRDYEELFKEQVAKNSTIEELVNGTAGQKGYYVDIEKDSRSHAIYPWRKE